MIDFDQWMKNMGIDVNEQPKGLENLIMILERLYDLIIDTRNQMGITK